ncbi:MAG: M13 family metallopeptidase, partial [Pseudomonadota bacterium]|nr:M13 family metallopeptidase [Pseudomonadota bacterium]
MRRFLAAVATILSAVAAAALSQPTSAPAAKADGPAWGTYGIDTAGMARSVHPGDDFWTYVNGTWARTVEIPPDRGALSQVNRLNDLAASQVRAIVEEWVGRRDGLSGDDHRVADYYAALVDQDAIEERGAAPLLEELRP